MSKLCILPWLSLETSPLGNLRPCCLATDNITNDAGQDLTVNEVSLQQAFNSNYMRNLRKDFIHGCQPMTCKRCWDEEAVGRTSKRINSWNRLKHLTGDIDFTTDTAHNLLFLDLKLGNICNLKCRICGSFSSSKWAQEELKIYPNNVQSRDNLTRGRWPQTSKLFWDNLQDILANVRYMEFTGGEPFLINEHFQLLNTAITLDCAKNIELHYNTNATVVPAAGPLLWSQFKSVEIAVSIDDIGNRFEYQRYGAVWQETLLNLAALKRLRAVQENITLQICITVNVQNIYYLDELVYWVAEQGFDYVYFNMLHDAWYFNICSLTQPAKNLINDKFAQLQLPYQSEIDKILVFMNQTAGSDCVKLIEVLKQSDAQRKQHFADSHQEIAEVLGYAKT